LFDDVRALVVERGIPMPDIPEPEPFDPSAPEEMDLVGVGASCSRGGSAPTTGLDPRARGPSTSSASRSTSRLASSVVPGLYFVGVHFLRKRKSSLLWGVGEDAAIVARQVAANRGP
jgi:putative flavoprotein involved in K+ transport